MVWLRTAVFASAFVATMFVLLPRWILSTTGQPPATGGVPRVGALVFLAAGLALMIWCFGAFSHHGRGTPAPFDPPRQLVIRGPYQYVRNPMYIAGLLVLLGEAMLFASVPLLVYAAAYWLAVHLMVVTYEERTLTRSFGSAYTAYCATVNRWLPRLTRPSDEHRMRVN